jgi:hypothetical protein
MERSTATADVRPSTRLTSFGMYVRENASASDLHPCESARKNGRECVKGVENGSGCERLADEDVPLKMMLRSREEGYANANVSESACPNVSESGVREWGNESVICGNANGCDRGDHADDRARGHRHHRNQTHSPLRRTWVKVVRGNAHAHDCGRHASANGPTRMISRPQRVGCGAHTWWWCPP